MKHPARLYNKLMNLIVRVAEHGLIHGDFNEFNLMINDQEVPTLIDFPQMVSTSHENAAMFFERDVNCIRKWFGKRFNFFSDDFPIFATDVTKNVELDISLAASGFSKEEAKKLESYFEEFKALEAEHGEVVRNNDDESDDDEDDGEDEDGEEEVGVDDASASDAAAAAEDDEDADLKPNANRTRKMYSKEAVAAELRRTSAAARANGAFADADEDDEDEEDEEDEDDEEDDEEEEVAIDEMLRKRDRVSQMVPKVKSAASSSAADEEVVDEAAVQEMIKQHLLAQVRIMSHLSLWNMIILKQQMSGSDLERSSLFWKIEFEILFSWAPYFITSDCLPPHLTIRIRSDK